MTAIDLHPPRIGDAPPAADFVPIKPVRDHSLLGEYLSIARRRKWLILGIVAGFFVVGLLITLFMTPQYTASATLEIQRETRNFTAVQGAEQAADPEEAEFYQTQYGLLQSRSLAMRVASSLRVQDDPDFFEMFDIDPPEGWFVDGRPVQSPAMRAARLRAAGGTLLAHMEVEPERMSRLVEVKFTSPKADFSKRVVDAWSENFIQSTLERRYAATAYARRFLEDRLQQLRTRIDESERALVGYASRENIVNIPGAATGGDAGERPLIAEDLGNLNRELAQATADRVLAESRLSASRANSREALDNQANNNLRTRRAELAADYARLMQQFEPGYPPARALQAQIATIDAALRGESARASGVLQQNFAAAQQRENELKARVETLTRGVIDFRRRSIQYNILQREADTNRQLYDALLQRYKQIGVAGGVGVNNIAVVDPGEEPNRPSSPRLLLNLAIALAAGTLVGLAAALLIEQIDAGITDPSDVEESLGVPLIGVTPRLADQQPVEALQDPKTPLAEAYASIVAGLGFATAHGVPRSLAVTSARPAEGKSSTSYALARSLARTRRRVLLVDADMRSPSVHALFGVALDKGLSNYLSGLDDVAQLVRPSGIDNLSLMTAGPQPPSTPELLSGDRFQQLVAQLTADYDHVIFDLPPVMGLADAPLIASRIEATLVVVAAHSTYKNAARLAIGRLQSAHVHLLGAILSMFDARQASYGYGYGYGYGYDHSYGQKS
jgi:succinoglycan biosynthesis transport protein ExoP